MGVPERDPLSELSLPPGFRFYPTDEELLVQYLCRKVAGHHFSLQLIGDIDLYKFDPWLLPSKALFGEKEWYFFSPRDRKYPNGSRPNRVAGSGYWKATGTDKVITAEGRTVGIKKALVFYIGKAPKGTKTNWIMHEYRLLQSSRKTGSSRLDDWVLCRIYKKSNANEKLNTSVSSKELSNCSSSSSSSHLEDVLESLPEIDDKFFALPRINSLKTLQLDEKLNFKNPGSGNFEYWANLAGLNSIPELNPVNQFQAHAQSQEIMNYNASDMYIPPLCNVHSPPGKAVEEEVQSGISSQRDDNSFFFQSNNSLSQDQTNSLDPYGFRYPGYNMNGFGSGFRQ